ncbi:MAG: dethiobiotin synthase [Desulfobulbus propionicus]|nr:MAG: dethiobiotin synthase [Desulfobulbus propionicus]PIE69879.1 MAG: dethiobiotin synthase [Deltaproteobacteria bacterium]
MHNTTIAITGVDTDVGKSIVTGLLAHYLKGQGKEVTTLKLVQTGCTEHAEDILLHRKLMGEPLSAFDKKGTTCPYLFPFPASPHLAAKMVKKSITTQVLDEATTALQQAYQFLLVEGAGGLMVPLNDQSLLIDYFKEKGYPVVLVTSSRLGSINHTRLSLEALKHRNMKVLGLVYNLHNPGDPPIVQDTLGQCRKALKDYGIDAPVILLPDTRESQAVHWQPLLAGLDQP